MVYGFTNFDEYDTDRGGPTPTWTFGIDGSNLEVTVIDADGYDRSKVPATVLEALEVLTCRHTDLQREVDELAAFIVEARKTTQVVTE